MTKASAIWPWESYQGGRPVGRWLRVRLVQWTGLASIHQRYRWFSCASAQSRRACGDWGPWQLPGHGGWSWPRAAPPPRLPHCRESSDTDSTCRAGDTHSTCRAGDTHSTFRARGSSTAQSVQDTPQSERACLLTCQSRCWTQR